MEDQRTEAIVTSTERLRDPETGQYLSRPSKNYIESRQRSKERLTEQLQDILQLPAADLEPLDSDPSFVALIKAQMLNGLTATGKDAGPAVRLIDTLVKTCGLQELPPAEINHGVRVVIIQPPPGFSMDNARPYVEHQTLLEPTFAAEPKWAEVTEITQNPAPKAAEKALTPEEARAKKWPYTQLSQG